MAQCQSKYSSSSPGYVLEWTPSQTCHRRVLTTVGELRSELLAETRPGLMRLIVLPGSLDDPTVETLRAIAGVDVGCAEAKRSCRDRRRAGVRAWCWRFPHMGRSGSTATYTASLWMVGEIPVLLVDQPSLLERVASHLAASEQDAATRCLTPRPSGSYGAMGQQQRQQGEKADVPPPSLEDDLRQEALDGRPMEEMLAQLVHERWVEFLANMRLLGEEEEEEEDEMLLLWEAMAALEQNADEARRALRRGQGRERVDADVAGCPADWDDLVQRLQLRIKLKTFRPTPSLPAAAATATSLKKGKKKKKKKKKDANERSLDRIAYLGGMLLPISVVADILSIEGVYGPEGGHFWVFWVASVVATAAALLVIYLDQLRSLEVWLEVGDNDNDDDDDPLDLADDDNDGGRLFVQRPRPGDHGARTKVWRRSELGWGGAVKKISGYYTWRGSRGIEFRRPPFVEGDGMEHV